MTRKTRNPGGQAGASQRRFALDMRAPFTASDRQAQTLASRFRLTISTARALAALCYGEGRDD